MSKQFAVNNFDLLRLVAAAQVMVTHSASHLQFARPFWWPLIEAFPGVPIFFVISGFLISASYERSSSLKNYARNRLLRILPGLWCCVIITIPIFLLFGFGFPIVKGIAWLACQLVGIIYTPAFLSGFGFGSYNGSLWTIPVELQFYFVLPILYWICRAPKQRTLYIAIVWLAFVLIAYAVSVCLPSMGELSAESRWEKLFRYTFVPHFYLFLTGVLLQRCGAHQWRWIAGGVWMWMILYLGAVFLLPAASSSAILCRLVLAVTAISAAYTLPGAGDRLLRGNDISYGVYIYHGLMINIFLQIGSSGGPLELLLLCVLTVVLAAMSWFLLERRFLRKKAQSMHAAAPA